MGVDYAAIAVVGIRLHKSDLTICSRVKAFPHNHPEDWKVDPITGNELWRDVEESVFGEYFEYGYDKLPGSKPLQTFHGDHEDEDPEIFIGRGVQTCSNRGGGGSARLSIGAEKFDEISANCSNHST